MVAFCVGQAIAGGAAPRAGSTKGPLVRSTARPDTGSVARLPLPKATHGVDPEAFDQSLPFHSHVAALGENMVPQPEGAVGIGWLPLPEAVGAGVAAGTASTGGIRVVPEPVEPELEEPEDAEPEPPQQAIGARFDPTTCCAPTSSTSWVTGS